MAGLKKQCRMDVAVCPPSHPYTTGWQDWRSTGGRMRQSVLQHTCLQLNDRTEKALQYGCGCLFFTTPCLESWISPWPPHFPSYMDRSSGVQRPPTLHSAYRRHDIHILSAVHPLCCCFMAGCSPSFIITLFFSLSSLSLILTTVSLFATFLSLLYISVLSYFFFASYILLSLSFSLSLFCFIYLLWLLFLSVCHIPPVLSTNL